MRGSALRWRCASVQLSRTSQVGPLGGSGRVASSATGTGTVVGVMRVAPPGSATSSSSSTELRPVSAKNTSSSVEWRTPTSSTSMCAPSSSRTARGTMPRRSFTGITHPATAVLDVCLTARQRGQCRDRARCIARVNEHDLDLLATDAPLEIGRSAPLDHLTVVDDRDVVREPVGLFEVLRREQGGHPARHELVDEVPHRVATARVEARGGLVEEQHGRLADEAHRDVEPTAHAARVGARCSVTGVGELEPLEQLTGAGAGVAALLVEQAPDVLEVLEAGESFVDRGVLPGESDTRPSAARVLHHVDAVDEGGARVGLQERREDAHRGGLAGAVGAQHAEHRRAFDGEVDPAQRLGGTESLRETDGFDSRHGRTTLEVGPRNGRRIWARRRRHPANVRATHRSRARPACVRARACRYADASA